MMKQILCLSLFLMIPCLNGCVEGTPRPEGMPKLIPCEITVTQDGTPAVGVLVTLYPQDASNKWVMSGGTDANGVAIMVTQGQFKGVPVGKYKVTLSRFIAGSDENDPGAEGVEEKYRDKNTTPLEIDVPNGGLVKETLDGGKAINDPLPKL